MSTDTKYLTLVQALLAKADRTEFAAEAEAFIAKAQELMARHAIDEAMLAGVTRDKSAKPTSIYVTISAPYASAKSILLNGIAKANGCKCIRITSGANQKIHVFGFESSLHDVELLYTALSLHATRELAHTSTPHYESARAFRHSFLVAFASRIGERLEEAADVAAREYEAETGRSTALVVVERGKEVAVAFRDAYPRTKSYRTSSSSWGGSDAGRSAADRADLGSKRVGGGSRQLGR